MNKISIITPIFNIIKDGRQSFFKQSFVSIHQQTYDDIEHIIIDGGLGAFVNLCQFK
jgi:glycosyltransferase involved in cell wall biosynthesis